jgi:exosome complex component CSL4
MKGKIVLPGDKLSTSEELLAGDGTFEEDGIIRAYRMGFYDIDEKRHTAMVKPLTSIPVVVKKGDFVLAHASSVRSMMVIADVFHVIKQNRSVSGDTNGTIHVSEISDGYVKSPEDKYSVGDIIRARVTQVSPSIQLTTKGKDLGTIKSFCQRCRNPLIKKDNFLECPHCGHKEKRKTAQDYGQYDLNNL